MAIEKMNRVSLTFRADHLENVLGLMQGFQGVHIETEFESTIQAEKKADVDKEIREIEKTIQEIRSASNVLKRRESANLFSALHSGEEKHLTIRELTQIVSESNWEEISAEVVRTDRQMQNNRLRGEETVKDLETLEIWRRLNYNPLEFKALKRSTALYGSLHNKHVEEFSDRLSAIEDEGAVFETVSEIGDRTYCFILFHNSLSEKIQAYINEFSFTEEEYPFDKPQDVMAAQIEAERKKLLAEEREIDAQIVRQEQYGEILAFAEDFNLNLLLRKQKSLEVTYSGESIVIDGWILENKREPFEEMLAKSVPASDYVLTIGKVRDRDIDEVPIKLKNNKIVSAFEQLTAMYSLPKYNEIDPTPVMTVFYLIFFGMMVSDAGYGLTIFVLGFLIKKFLKINRGTKSFVDFLFYLSFPIMGWGLVFGSFFGMVLPTRLIDANVDVIPLTIISIIFGYVHIMTGLVLHTINQIHLKRTFDMLTGSLSWFVSFLGGGMMLASRMIPVPGLGVLFPIGSVLLAIGLGMIVVVPAIQYKKRWYMGLGKGLYTLYGATGYFGDFISYTRLMALGIAGGSVAEAFNTIINFLPFAAKITLGIVLAVVLHGFNIFLTMLSAYVHGIRLQFIEFFGKFYTGGGKPFDPFKAAEKNVIIKDEA